MKQSNILTEFEYQVTIGSTMKIILTAVILWILTSPLIAQTIIIDSLYAIPELDGSITANTAGLAFSMNTTTYEFDVGDLCYPYENCSVRAFISFPLPIIPSGYSLVNATIRLYQFSSGGIEQLDDSTYVNTYFPHWDVADGDTLKCIVSHIDYGLSLDLGDWSKGDAGSPDTFSPNVGEITWEGIDEPGNEPGHHGEAGYRYLDITDCVLNDLAFGSLFSQYRIAFQIDTDYDYGWDFVAFLSANSNPNYPEFLPITYYTLYNPTTISDDLSPAVLVDVSSSPNPFSSQIKFDISLDSPANVCLKLYDLRGRIVKERGSTQYSKGTHSISMNTNELPSGIYLLQVKAGNKIITKKITCLK
ncbi:MAG TPA: T9SS type A sorting domain-containing protein [Candidatus Cloacimonadota bacterium]|nr:T9SS type A sorting domain-containing protein [Candidatus Cloacimonadota bacterium]